MMTILRTIRIIFNISQLILRILNNRNNFLIRPLKNVMYCIFSTELANSVICQCSFVRLSVWLVKLCLLVFKPLWILGTEEKIWKESWTCQWSRNFRQGPRHLKIHLMLILHPQESLFNYKKLKGTWCLFICLFY